MNYLHILVVFNVLFTLLASGTVVVTAENIHRPGPARRGGSSSGVGGLYGIVGSDLPSYHHFVGQTFTASKGGILHSASFVVINHSINAIGNDITVSIAPIIGGKVGRILDSSCILYSAVPRETALSPYQSNYNITARFTSQVKIIAGQRYALTVGSLGDLVSHYRIWSPANDESTYKPGYMFENTIDGVAKNRFEDVFFRVRVNRSNSLP